MIETDNKKQQLADIGKRLNKLYTPEELVQWLFLPQPLLGGEVAAKHLLEGDFQTVGHLIQGMEDCVYI